MPNAPENAASTAPKTGESPDPLVGRTIDGRYEILGVLAKGGMGKVYKARQAPLGRTCAVKVLHGKLAGPEQQEFHARFFQEASVAAKLSHPNTVKIFDYGCSDDKVYYMAMEFLEGRTLYDLIKREAPLPAERAVHIAQQVCRSLREAHGHSVVHRDLKPGNIFLTRHADEDDFVKLLDFGLVKNTAEGAGDLTQSGIVAGTPKYMAPEQIRGEAVCAATDVYSLGVVLYEMLTGKAPFHGKQSIDTLKGHLDEPVPPMEEKAPGVSVPASLQAVVFKCLAKEIPDRYPSMEELLAALKAAMGMGSRETLTVPVAAVAAVATGPSAVVSTPPRAEVSAGAGGATVSRLSLPPQPEVPRGKPAGLWLGAAAVVAAVAVGAVVKLRGGGASGAAGAARGGAAQPRVVQVALESTPPHAQVFEDNVFLGTTPLRLEWTGERADPSRSHTFTFRLPGYREATATLSGAMLVHAVALQAEAVADAGAVGASAGQAGGGAAAAGSAGQAGGVRRAPVRRGGRGGRGGAGGHDHNNDFW